MTSTIRRRFLAAAALLPLIPASRAAPCGRATPSQTEGPFFKPGTPARTSLLPPGARAQRLVLTGQVTSGRQCRPLAGALVEFWHADESGRYDNIGHRYRGHQLTDDEGRYRLETIVPGRYAGRTAHIHVKVLFQGEDVLTTQLYLPNEPANRRDFLYRPDLEVANAGSGVARFDFLVGI